MVAKIESFQNWKLIRLKVFQIKNCEVVKLPKLKIAKIENWSC